MKEETSKEESDNNTTTSSQGGGGCCSMFYKFPRLSAILGGIILPLLLITAISLFLGHFLGKIELTTELDSNDNILANRNAVEQYKHLISAIITTIPRYCFKTLTDKNLESDMEAKINDVIYTSTTLLDSASQDTNDYQLAMEVEEMRSIIRLLNASLSEHTGTDIEHLLPFIEPGYNSSNLYDDLNAQISFTASSLLVTPSNDSTLQSNNESQTFLQGHNVLVVDTTEMSNHFKSCGAKYRSLIEDLQFRQYVHSLIIESEGLTFNWNRCMNHSADHNSARIAALPQNQETYYANLWAESQEEVYHKYLYGSSSSSSNNPPTLLDRIDAYRLSLEEATGRHGCDPNNSASAWFWFTVMTTMGYGNYAPETTGGRTMVYTLGLLSLLVFGAYLGTTGNIVVFLWDDFAVNIGMKPIDSPWVGSLFWGGLWYIWMIFVALYAQYYWTDWMQLSGVTFRDSYWFAYISTTTIGLGDYYPQPEELFFMDVYIFSILMLLGFVLLSSFLGHVGDIFSRYVPKSFSDLLEDRLGNPMKRWEEKTTAKQSNNDNIVTTETEETIDQLRRELRTLYASFEEKFGDEETMSNGVSFLEQEKNLLNKIQQRIQDHSQGSS